MDQIFNFVVKCNDSADLDNVNHFLLVSFDWLESICFRSKYKIS